MLTKKKYLIFLFLSFSSIIYSQKKVVTKFQSDATQIEISTLGLDDFVLENATSEFIEIYLTAENSKTQHIIYKELDDTIKIEFKIPEITKGETVFKKFITKRLERASVVIKIPQKKSIIIFGDNINIESKNYDGSLDIYIEKGILKLNTIQENTKVKLYAGSVYANLKKSNINVSSNSGTIAIDKKIQQEKFYKKTSNSAINLSIVTTNANIFLTTLKTQ